MGALAEQDGGNGLENDPEIQQKRGIVDIFDVELHPILEAGNRTSPTDLPETCQPGMHAQSPAMGALFNPFCFIIWKRSGTDNAHIPPENIKKLGEFIQTRAANEFSNVRDTGILFDFECGAFHFVLFRKFRMEFRGIHNHRPEFQNREAPPSFATPYLTENHGARGGQFDRGGYEHSHRKEKQDSDTRHDDVQESFREMIPKIA
jgi:hypothetical protein